MRDLIVEFVREVLSERRKGRKPGGPRTDFGAEWQLNPDKAATKAKGALKSAKGDVDKAAGRLDLSPRTLYHYLDNEPELDGVETKSDKEGSPIGKKSSED